MNSESCYVAGMSALMTVLCVLLMYLASITFVRAQDHAGHPPQDQALHDKFYSNWMQPDNPNLSCCNQIDCYPTEMKNVGGTWFAKQRENGKWIPIPEAKLEQNRDSPDGLNHVCMNPQGVVFCAKLGNGI